MRILPVLSEVEGSGPSAVKAPSAPQPFCLPTLHTLALWGERASLQLLCLSLLTHSAKSIPGPNSFQFNRIRTLTSREEGRPDAGGAGRVGRLATADL